MGARPDVILNGVKTYNSPSNVADVIVVFARADTSVGLTQSMTAFIVGKDTAGFNVAQTIARFTGGRYWVGARRLGVAREAVDLALEYVKRGVQGANPSSSTG